jgi:hypothetical protein
MTRLRAASMALALGLTAAVQAHEGGHDVRGVVSAVSADELTVKTSRDEERFALTADTEFVKNGKPAAARDLKPSQRVVVHSKKQNGRMEAIKVQLGGP